VRFLEANFPFYYPHAQLHGGVDIAGQMVDYLAAKARFGGPLEKGTNSPRFRTR
jgi:hypothetical protein